MNQRMFTTDAGEHASMDVRCSEIGPAAEARVDATVTLMPDEACRG
jgi:hypothetical protein